MSRKTAERLVISNLTDVGMVRESNQDYYGKYNGGFGDLILVCDGMGGYRGGKLPPRWPWKPSPRISRASGPNMTDQRTAPRL